MRLLWRKLNVPVVINWRFPLCWGSRLGPLAPLALGLQVWCSPFQALCMHSGSVSSPVHISQYCSFTRPSSPEVFPSGSYILTPSSSTGFFEHWGERFDKDMQFSSEDFHSLHIFTLGVSVTVFIYCRRKLLWWWQRKTLIYGKVLLRVISIGF